MPEAAPCHQAQATQLVGPNHARACVCRPIYTSSISGVSQSSDMQVCSNCCSQSPPDVLHTSCLLVPCLDKLSVYPGCSLRTALQGGADQRAAFEDLFFTYGVDVTCARYIICHDETLCWSSWQSCCSSSALLPMLQLRILAHASVKVCQATDKGCVLRSFCGHVHWSAPSSVHLLTHSACACRVQWSCTQTALSAFTLAALPLLAGAQACQQAHAFSRVWCAGMSAHAQVRSSNNHSAAMVLAERARL